MSTDRFKNIDVEGQAWEPCAPEEAERADCNGVVLLRGMDLFYVLNQVSQEGFTEHGLQRLNATFSRRCKPIEAPDGLAFALPGDAEVARLGECGWFIRQDGHLWRRKEDRVAYSTDDLCMQGASFYRTIPKAPSVVEGEVVTLSYYGRGDLRYVRLPDVTPKGTPVLVIKKDEAAVYSLNPQRDERAASLNRERLSQLFRAPIKGPMTVIVIPGVKE